MIWAIHGSAPPREVPGCTSALFNVLCTSAVASLSSPVAQQRRCAARRCGSTRLTDVIGQSLTFIGIPLSLCQRERGRGLRASWWVMLVGHVDRKWAV